MRWSIVVAVGLAGCGPTWAGSYAGPVTTRVSCSDGSGSASSAPLEVEVSQSGSTVEAEPVCGATISGELDGDTATVAQADCPVQPVLGADGGYAGEADRTIVEGGTLRLAGDALELDLVETIVSSRGMTCDGRMAGTLTRR